MYRQNRQQVAHWATLGCSNASGVLCGSGPVLPRFGRSPPRWKVWLAFHHTRHQQAAKTWKRGTGWKNVLDKHNRVCTTGTDTYEMANCGIYSAMRVTKLCALREIYEYDNEICTYMIGTPCRWQNMTEKRISLQMMDVAGFAFRYEWKLIGQHRFYRQTDICKI